MLKIEKEYQTLYGNIPKNESKRLDYILQKLSSARSVKGHLLSQIDFIRRISWKELSYTIYIVPKATPRPRSSANHHFYVSGAADHKKLFKKFYKANADLPLITTPCEFYCKSYLPIPKSMKPVEQIIAELGYIRPISKPDFDNLIKTYTDMTQGMLLYDDALIVKGISEKYYSVKPRVEITIRYMVDHDSEYNKKKIERKCKKP